MPRECPACGTNAFDQVGIYVNPADYLWNLVEGGRGTTLDPVDGPQTSLTSLWTFGGAPGHLTARGSRHATVPVASGSSQYLSITLDTATAQSHDTASASWGRITNVQLVPYIGTVAQPAPTLTWTRSSYDPDAGTSFSLDAHGLDVTLAAHDFGSAPRDSQLEGIWGVGARLPGRDAAGRAYTSYSLRFDYDLTSLDARGTASTQLTTVPTRHVTTESPVSLAVVLVAVLAFAHRGRRDRVG